MNSKVPGAIFPAESNAKGIICLICLLCVHFSNTRRECKDSLVEKKMHFAALAHSSLARRPRTKGVVHESKKQKNKKKEGKKKNLSSLDYLLI